MRGWRISKGSLGNLLVGVGLAVVIAIPTIYSAIAATSRHHRAWWWPTWWMLLPIGVFIVGAVLSVTEWDQEESEPSNAFDAPPGAELKVCLETEQFHPFNHKAVIAELKVSVRNLTSKPKYITGIEWTTNEPLSAGQHDIDVRRKTYYFKSRHPAFPGLIDPGDEISGWTVTNLPHQPMGGVGEFTLTLKDEVGAKYVYHRPSGSRAPAGRPKRTLATARSLGSVIKTRRLLLLGIATALIVLVVVSEVVVHVRSSTRPKGVFTSDNLRGTQPAIIQQSDLITFNVMHSRHGFAPWLVIRNATGSYYPEVMGHSDGDDAYEAPGFTVGSISELYIVSASPALAANFSSFVGVKLRGVRSSVVQASIISPPRVVEKTP